MRRSSFYTPLVILPTSGRWLLLLAQRTALAAGRGLGLWRLVEMGATIFNSWTDCPVVGPDGAPFWIDLRNGGFEYLVYGWRTSEVEPLIRGLREDAIVLDIGANVGVWTRLFSSHCKSGHVYAFEPSEPTIKRLERNCQTRANITIISCALGAESGKVQFSGNDVDSKLRSMQSSPSASTVAVTTRRLDDWVRENGITRIDFMKIDVEGFEEEVLIPSIDVLERYKPTLCFEFVPEFAGSRSSFRGKQLMPALRALGYRIFRLDKQGRAFSDFDASEDWTNDYLATM